ncbi:DUF3828 domain-containing protein [Cronobacter malonaticus]|uniref:DUF3828 domain-containing protein n=1 Tax=Cronobacter malonaticus TaxID=413503 RepID=UPI002894E6A0|nr:DUF3828 domain-containing protein [Cronobacter malonaticus]ELY5938158.1 YbjP/YqhG family protein [Cronobacter malonaticus]ELY6203434.1 YbjP/YqhG family protein [Cronobacter malonaticus]ELY6259529.1 YbjP/YqhG family protein [Cronobacter malonaticus]MDT3560130.1 DUF3828 domain-containing protein [Cronobacter malonaticus]
MKHRLALVMLFFSASTLAQGNAQTPTQFLKSLYQSYAKGNEPVDFASKGEQQILSDRLLSLVEEDTRLSGGEVGFLDYDPICYCQDWDDLAVDKINVTNSDATHANATITFRPFRSSPDATTQSFTLINEKGRWRIDDIMNGNGSLYKSLQESGQQLRADSTNNDTVSP